MESEEKVQQEDYSDNKISPKNFEGWVKSD